MGYFPESIEGQIAKNTKHSLQNAANTLQKKYIEGLSVHYTEITIINAPFVGYYGYSYCRPRVPSSYSVFHLNNARIDVHSFSFRTLPLLYSKERYFRCRLELKQWLNGNQNESNTIVVYSMHRPFIDACVYLKKYYDFTLIVIVPDLPCYMNASTKVISRLHSKFNELVKKDHVEADKCIDGFVYLTEQMNHRIIEEDRPFVVIEGMVSNRASLPKAESSPRGKYILYSGTMAKKYGVMNLVEAFKLLRHNDYWLYLCGDGDTIDEIRALEGQYKIRLLGMLPNSDVLELQRKASLLVNPRLNDEEFTKYSFPSKIMEYFASGTPTIMHKLSGIPSDYFNYCYSFCGSNPSEIADRIDNVLDYSEEQRLSLAARARSFVYEQKNASSQCLKLLKLIEHLENNKTN